MSDILFVAGWFPSSYHHSLGNFIERHAKAVAVKHRVVVFHPIISNRFLRPKMVFRKVDGIEVAHAFIPGWIQKTGLISLLLRKYLQHLKKNNFVPHLVHGHVLFHAGEIAVWLAKALKIPLVFTEHWSKFLPFNQKELSENTLRKVRQLARECEFILPVSENLRVEMQKLQIDGNYRVVENTVDTRYFNLSESPSSVPFTFIHVSNYHVDSKNPFGLLRGFALAGERSNIPLRLVMVGDESDEELKRSANEIMPSSVEVVFRQNLPYHEVANQMKNAQCLVLFSNYENAPCVISEAHCTGIPVIATHVGGIPDMVNSENGLLIPPGDENALAEAILKMTKIAPSFDTKKIAAIAQKRYSYPTICNAFSQIYQEVLEGNKLP